MKSINCVLNIVSFLLAFLILFQSCSIYKSGTLSLDEAVLNEKRVKVVFIDNEKQKFKKIVVEDEEYYGVMRYWKRSIKLNPENIKKIKELDVVMTSSVSLLIAGIPIFLLRYRDGFAP